MSFRPPAARIFADITGLVLLVGSPSLLANQTGRTETQRIRHQFEREALQDYEHPISPSDVLQRGQILMRLAPQPYFATDGRNCQGAAEALSSIVSGHDFSAHRLDFAFDQHPCRRPYLEQRWACLQDLGLVARAFPLR